MHKQHMVHLVLSRISNSYLPSHYDHGSVSFQTLFEISNIENAHSSRTIGRRVGN